MLTRLFFFFLSPYFPPSLHSPLPSTSSVLWNSKSPFWRSGWETAKSEINNNKFKKNLKGGEKKKEAGSTPFFFKQQTPSPSSPAPGNLCLIRWLLTAGKHEVGFVAWLCR